MFFNIVETNSAKYLFRNIFLILIINLRFFFNFFYRFLWAKIFIFQKFLLLNCIFYHLFYFNRFINLTFSLFLLSYSSLWLNYLLLRLFIYIFFSFIFLLYTILSIFVQNIMMIFQIFPFVLSSTRVILGEWIRGTEHVAWCAYCRL